MVFPLVGLICQKHSQVIGFKETSSKLRRLSPQRTAEEMCIGSFFIHTCNNINLLLYLSTM